MHIAIIALLHVSTLLACIEHSAAWGQPPIEFSQLPDEILLQILWEMEARDLANFMTVPNELYSRIFHLATID